MKLLKRKRSGREKDEASIRLLAQLKEKLYSDHVGGARRAAYHLSWLQEDGLDILREALFNDIPKKTKSSATYGLRKMRGRMKKLAIKVLEEGLKHPNADTVDISKNALLVLKNKKAPYKAPSKKKARNNKIEIRGIHRKSKKFRSREKTTRRRSNYPR